MKIGFREIAEIVDQLLFDLQLIAAGLSGNGFRQFVAGVTVGGFQFAPVPFRIARILRRKLLSLVAPRFRNERPGEILILKSERGANLEIGRPGEIRQMHDPEIVLVMPLVFHFLFPFPRGGEIVLCRLRSEIPRILFRCRNPPLCQKIRILGIFLVRILPDKRPHEIDNALLFLRGIFLNGKPDMLVHTDILIRKRNIVPDIGAVPDICHAVDSRAVKKFADRLRFAQNLLQIFIDHGTGRHIPVQGFSDHVPLRVKPRRLVVCGVQLLPGNIFPLSLSPSQFP